MLQTISLSSRIQFGISFQTTFTTPTPVTNAGRALLATIENNHYESGENHQKKSKRKSHYYNNSKGSTIVLANNAQKIGANE